MIRSFTTLCRPAAARRVVLFSLAVCCGMSQAVEGTAEPTAAPEANADGANHWGALRLLEGAWQGQIDGRLGQGTGLRRYEFIFDDRYLLMRHDSVRPPQEKSPEGDQHHELSIFSYDRQREAIVLREFMMEGYVLTSICNAGPQTLVCTTEAIESGPGMQARLTLTLTDAYRFEERFELAWPGEELQIYFTNAWKRIPDLPR